MRFAGPRVAACAALFFCAQALATVTATDAWVRGTVPAQKITGAFLTLQSSEDAKVVGVTSAVSRSAEIHESEMDHGTMRMKAVEFVALPAGKRVEMKPGGFHVMLVDLTRPLAAGDMVPLTFTVEDSRGRRSTLEVRAEVRPLGR